MLATTLSAPVALADSDCPYRHQEDKGCRQRPKVPRRFGVALSFFKKNLHLRNGELFISASRTAALRQGISEEVFSKFQQAAEEMNEMKEEGLLTFKKEKGIVMINFTDKMDRKADSMRASEGPSLAATSSCGGVTKLKIQVKWWGTQMQVWLNSCDASYWADVLTDSTLTFSGVTTLIASYFGGAPGILVAVFWAYAGYIGNEIPQYNNGTGVVINFASIMWWPGMVMPPTLPVPDVWSQ